MEYVVLFVGHLYKPFQTIWVDRVGRGGQGRSKSAPEWPESGVGAVQKPPNWSMNPEMDPKCFPQLPVIDSSPFPNLLKHYSLYILKKTLIILYGQKYCFLIFQLCQFFVANWGTQLATLSGQSWNFRNQYFWQYKIINVFLIYKGCNALKGLEMDSNQSGAVGGTILGPFQGS